MNVGIKQLNFYKNRIKQQLDNIRSDIGDLKYELYIKMVDGCEDYYELLEMAELEMQIDFLNYTKGNIMNKLEKENITVRDLKEAIDNETMLHLDKPIETDEEYEIMSNMEDMSEVDDSELDAAILRQLIQREEAMPEEERNRDNDYLPGMEVNARLEEQWEDEQLESLFDFDDEDEEENEEDIDNILGDDDYDEDWDDDDILGADIDDDNVLDTWDEEDDDILDEEDEDDILGYDDEYYNENTDDAFDENSGISEEDFFLASEGSEFSNNLDGVDDEIGLDEFFSDDGDEEADESDDDYDGVFDEDEFFLGDDDEDFDDESDEDDDSDVIDEDDFFLDDDELDEYDDSDDILGDEESDEDILGDDEDILGDEESDEDILDDDDVFDSDESDEDFFDDDESDEDILGDEESDEDILGDDDIFDDEEGDDFFDDEDDDILGDDDDYIPKPRENNNVKDTLVDFGGDRKQLFKDAKTQNTFNKLMGLTSRAEKGLKNMGNNKKHK